MSPHGSVLATLPRALLAYLGVHGVDVDAAAREVGLALDPIDPLDPRDQGDDDLRVPRERVDALWELAERHLGPTVGVRFALARPPGDAGALEVVALSAPSVGAAFGHVCRYWHLLNDGVDFVVEERGSEVALAVRARSERPLAPAWIDLTAAGVAVFAARSIARPRSLIRVELPYAASRAVSELADLVAAPLTFGGDRLAVVYPRELLGVPLLAANATLHQLALTHAESLLSRARELDDLPARVRAAAEARLESGDATLEGIAGALGISARTLQRRLREAGTGLRAILDDARRTIALRELSRGGRTVTDIAFLLGFSEASAFDRAFRRWTGGTPAAFRRGGAGRGP